MRQVADLAMSGEKKTVYTIGHSNRSISEFIHLLKSYGISAVVDVRRFPSSKRVPWFNRDVLERALVENNVKYYWLGDLLGGFRREGYLEYMRKEEFRRGLSELLTIISKEEKVAIMCRERLWFKCHRRFIADELARRGYEVVHIIDEKRSQKHKIRSQER